MVYGEKNVGKTLFILHLALLALNRGFKVLFYTQHNNIKKHHEAFFTKKGLTRILVETPTELSDILRSLIENLNKTNRLFIILDPLPLPSICENPRPRFVAHINNFLFTLSAISKYLRTEATQTLIALISTFEDCLIGLPYYRALFEAYDYTLIRLSRIHRLRLTEFLQPTEKGDYNRFNALKIYLTPEKITILEPKD